MGNEQLHKIKNFRRMSEIGGILLGLGIGIGLTQVIPNTDQYSTIRTIAAIAGLGILLYEQNSWSKFNK